MNLKDLVSSSKTKTLAITTPTILHIVPDFGQTLYQMIETSGLKLSYCGGIVTKSGILNLAGHSFNAKKLYNDTKQFFSSNMDRTGVINVIQTPPKEILENKYLIIDHTITSQVADFISQKTNKKRALFYIFEQIKKEARFLKTKYPKYENDILFLINPNITKDVPSIYDVLHLLSSQTPDDLKGTFTAFDRLVLVSVNSTIFPIMGFDNKGNLSIYKVNLGQVSKYFTEPTQTIGQLASLVSVTPETTPGTSITNIAHDITGAVIATPDTTPSEGYPKNEPAEYKINQTQLSKILKKYQIKDRSIADNIKQALDKYIKSKKGPVEEKDLEQVILKAIHFTIFNTDNVSETYLNNPAKLINKLEEVNTYSKNIEIPVSKDQQMLPASEVVGLNRVTGLVRQEYEFSDNIHKSIKQLFRSLETRKNAPVKVLKVDYTYEDNDLNRVINYKVTLQNMSGGYAEPYVINVKVPSLVNDRYFKLNGKTYVLSNQQFFVPVTKTDSDECRLLTCYATMTLSVVNIKFNISEIDKIIEYIESHYPELVVQIERENFKITKAEFKGDIHIDLYGDIAYTSPVSKLFSENNKWMLTVEGETSPLTKGKSEYLYDRLLDLIATINPNEKLQKSTRSIPYIQVYISGIKLPLIIYMWQQLGLLNALTRFGIHYEIDNEIKPNGFSFALKNNKFLTIYTKSKRDELITNGLLTIDRKRIDFDPEQINDKHSIDEWILFKCGSRATYQLDLLTENLIDPITHDLLEFQDRPTELLRLVTDEMVDKLLNDPADSLTDLKIYRSRQAELMFHLMYKELMIAHNTYRNELLSFGNPNAKMFLRDSYIVECLLGIHPHSSGNAVVELSTPYNPVDELKVASKIIKTGPGGIPGKLSFKKEHRGIHPSYYGNIGM